MKRRNSGCNKIQKSYTEIVDLNQNDKVIPPNSIRASGIYPRIVHESNDSVFLSPKINDCIANKLNSKRASSYLKCFQSTQELPRMQLFNEIISKVMKNKRISYLKMFMINLYKEAFPQLEGYISNFNLTSPPNQLRNSGVPPNYPQPQISNRSENQNSSKSTGRFHHTKNKNSECNTNNEVVIEKDSCENEEPNCIRVSSQETLSFRNNERQECSKINETNSLTNFFSCTSGKEVEATREILKQINVNSSNKAQSVIKFKHTSSKVSFCDPEFASEQKIELLEQINVELVWKMKKKIVQNIFIVYRTKVHDSFKEWKNLLFKDELQRLKYRVVLNCISNKDRSLLRNAIQQLKRNCSSCKMNEEIKCKVMQRWKKTLIFKVFKINRKQRQKDRKGSSIGTNRAKSRYDS